jgi:tetratricopeptide (TPR) repeat protein
MPGSTDSLQRLREIEDSIEEAMWRSGEDGDYDQAIRVYVELEEELRSLSDLSERKESERLRILSYCIMRHSDAMGHVDTLYDSMSRSEEALELAERSGCRVQTLRARMALGVAMLNKGQLPEAEKHFAAIITETRDETEDKDIIQVFGWTLIVRVNILLGKSLYNQAEDLAKQALSVLAGIENYAGLRTANSLLGRIYEARKEPEKARSYRGSAEYYAKLAKEHRQ